jgi:hypothetical protein
VPDDQAQHDCKGATCDFLLTPAEVAERLRVRPSWVYQHQADLPVFKLGRYVRCRCGELSRFLEKIDTWR